MSCRCRCLRLRMRTRLALVFIIIVFVGLIMTYQTLNVQDNLLSPSSSLPTLGRRRSFRFRPREDFHILKGLGGRRSSNNHSFGSGSTRHSLTRKDVEQVLTILYPVNWKSAQEPAEAAIILKDHMLELNLPSNMTCKEIDDLQISVNMGSSNKKFVEQAEEHNIQQYSYNLDRSSQNKKPMVVKSQAYDVQTKIACMKQIYNAEFCHPMGNYLLMREMFFLSVLQHPSLIRVLGYCLRGDRVSKEMHRKGLVLVTEAGMPLSQSVISSLSWARRVQLSLDAATLLEFLQSSPLGDLGLHRLEMKDFVLVGQKRLKLADLDDVLLEDQHCRSSSECLLHGSEVGVECQEGQCKGLNHHTNLWMFGRSVLEPLLQMSPPEEKKMAEEMLDRIQHLDITPYDLITYLEELAEKYEDKEETELENLPGYKALKKKPDERLNVDSWHEKEDEDEEDSIHQNVVETKRSKVRGDTAPDTGQDQPERVKDPKQLNPRPRSYKRLDSSNFPGMYDYKCKDSRVLWGCVMTVSSLTEAMDYCSRNADCHAFAVFSSQPEDESRMTVVFKGQNNGIPYVNLGVTLFLKKDDPSADEDDKNVGKAKAAGNKVNGTLSEAERIKEVQQCANRNHINQDEALHSREKRLMAHMGLKGKLESEWRWAVGSQNIMGFSNLHPISGRGSEGGSMMIQFSTSTPGHIIARAKFLMEKGNQQNHVAFAMVYQLDRILGLYHTPPATEGSIPDALVKNFSKNTTWLSTFQSSIQSDGSLRGLFVAPTPKVMKRSELILKPRMEMVSEVMPFDRAQKMQLEYVLLWWLGHMDKPNDLHKGFKGHLIHVDADLGFQKVAGNFENYFNHCQFPNVVYKMLACYRCGGNAPSKVCFLGQEVVQRVELTGFDLADIRTGKRKDFIQQINGAASHILEVVDKCVHTFGREAVLY